MKQGVENRKDNQTKSENIKLKKETSKAKKNQEEEPENYWEGVAV